MNANLLVAEDHEAARELISQALEGEGYNLFFAETGTQASRVLGEKRFDAALLDVSLPGVTGLDLCRQIKSNREAAGTPVIIMSGALGARELAEESTEAGADAYIAKPFSLDELRTVLRAFSRIREQAVEIAELRQRLARAEALLSTSAAGESPLGLDWTLPYHQFTKLARKAYFIHALAATGGNKSKLARQSGLDRSTLYVHLRNLGMLVPRKKDES
jgi:DNA-binding response OmpR family regulator